MKAILFGLLLSRSLLVSSFQLRPIIISPTSGDSRLESSTSLCMAKKIRNKQAELAKKLALAKEQNALKVGVDPSSPDELERLSDKEMKERNDRLRFEELLQKQAASLNDISSDGYLNKQQEEAEIDAYRKLKLHLVFFPSKSMSNRFCFTSERGLDRIFEGDAAPIQPFEELVNIKSENAIGDTGVKRLVPWLKNTKSDYLIIICDPRVQSQELRETLSNIKSGLSQDMLSKMVVINADTPAENRRWLKKSNLDDLTVFSDEKREWMRSYTALGEDRWSMTLFIIADERVQKIAREMESLSAVKVIQNAVNSMKERRL